MNTLDELLLDDLADLPGWNDLSSAPTPVASPEALSRSTAAVRAAIATDESRAMSGDLIRRGMRPIAASRRRRTRWAMAVVAGAAAAALVIAAPTVSTPGNAPVSVATASEFLTHLASTATSAPGIEDPYWKVTFTSVNPMNPAPGSDQETTTTLWYGRNGGQWIATGGGEAIKASDAKEQFAVLRYAVLTWAQVTELPTDASALETYLKSLVRDHQTVVDAAAHLLETAPLSAGQRAALFTILSHQPGVTIRKGVTDTAGRTGTELTFPLGGTVTMTVLLADDGTLLQETAFDSRPGGVPPSPGATPTSDKSYLLSRATFIDVGGTTTAPGK